MSLSASAGEIIVYDISVHELGYAEMKGKFDFNQESRRAWVTISFTPSYTDDSVIYDERAKVKGLSLNNELNKVVLETDSTPIVCATLKKNFFGTFLKETGKCTFKNV